MRGMGVEAVRGDGWWEIQINDSKGCPLMRMNPGEADRLARRFADRGHHDLAERLRHVCTEAASLNAQLKKVVPNSAGNFLAGQAIPVDPAGRAGPSPDGPGTGSRSGTGGERRCP